MIPVPLAFVLDLVMDTGVVKDDKLHCWVPAPTVIGVLDARSMIVSSRRISQGGRTLPKELRYTLPILPHTLAVLVMIPLMS